jgi:hypothetical protein
MAAYERFAIKQPPFVSDPTFLQGTEPKPIEARLTQPAPPASKTVGEPSTDASTHLAALVTVESLKLIQDQQTVIEQLAKICEKMMQERDSWKGKTEGSPSSKAPQNEAVREDKRIEALRRLLARELHPDKAKLSAAEAAVHNDLFQRLWPQIDRIAKGQSIK